MGALVFTLFLVALAVLVLVRSVTIVKQGYEYTLERLGRYTTTLRPGFTLIIPFVVIPDLLIAATYGLTCIGLISPCVVMVPWTTPVLLSGWLATAGDFRAVIWQVIEIAVSMAIYLPFMKISERAQAKQLENASEEE